MDVALRRMRADDISQVVEIEREAFSPGWAGAQFRRDLNNRHCRFLVAYLTGDDESAEDTVAEDVAAAPDSSLWGKMVRGVRSVFGAPPSIATTGWPVTWGYGSRGPGAHH